MSTVPDPGAITLGPGDLVAFSLHGVPDVTSPPEGTRITLEGALMVPVLGPVPVAGLTEAEAHALLTERLSRFYREPSVTLSVVERRARRFHLVGQFERPGPQVLEGPLTAIEAVSYGEGLKRGANRERVCLIRRHDDGVEVHTFSYEIPGEDGLVQVLPGDVLYVTQSGAGRFDDRVIPYLQGLGFTVSQIASLIIVADNYE